MRKSHTTVKRFPLVLGIRTKLLVSFVLVAMFTGVLGLNAVATVYRLNAANDTLDSEIIGTTRALADWLNQARVSEGDLAEYMLETDAVARANIRAEMASTDAHLAELGATFDGSAAGPSESASLASLSQAWRVYTSWRDQSILAPLEAGQFVEARAAFHAEGDTRSAAVERAILGFLDAKNASANDLKAVAVAEGQLEVKTAAGLTAAAMVLALLIGYFLARDIARAARQVATAAKGLAVGDLNQKITVHSTDELGQMADAVRGMIAYQHEMADVARAMAMGDLTQNVTPKGASDVLGIAFGHMTANLRTFVSNLQEQTATLSAQAQLLELANDAIIVSDFDTGVIRFWNRGAEEMYGFSGAEALGKTGGLLLERSPDDEVKVEAELRRGGRWDGELVHTRRDTSHLIVASRQAVQRDQSGQPLAVLQINTNITERKRTEADRTRLATLVERERTSMASILASMTDGLVQMDDAGRVAFCNAPAAALLGTSVETLAGKTGAELFAELRSSLVDPAAVLEGLNADPAARPTYELVFKGPPQRTLLLQRFAIGGTGALGLLLHDVTAERELVRAKDELVSMVSHELASPATSLVAYAGLLAEHEYPEPERRDMLATMVQEGQRLTGIIQDFLDIQRLEHGRFQFSTRPMELRPLLEHAARVASTDTEHPLTVDLPSSLPLVQADPNRVQQVLANLLSNARKYTPANRRIWLSARQIDAAIEISVADEGLGIPPEAQPHLFEKFYRVDADDRQLIKGTGLGLAIVKEIVEALGGQIGAESAGSGHGSRFWFTVPLAVTSSARHAAGDAGRPSELLLLPPTSMLRVLVVDDDAAIRNTVRRVLRPDGHAVTLVASAEEALEFFQTETFDVVLTDLGLGSGMDGWQLAGRIQRDWPAVRVILASGRAGIDAAEASAHGVAALLGKPYQADDLRRLVIEIGRGRDRTQAAA